MLGTVVIPCFNRPGFLTVCLEFIQQADNCKEYQYLFAVDHGYTKDVIDVIDGFPLQKAISIRDYKVMGVGKQSNNVLTGLYNASQFNLPIFYIEDDIFIGKDFFTFGQQIVAQNPDILCAILSRNHNAQDTPPADINGYYVKDNHNCYQGLGSIFNPAMFKQYIAPHCTSDYVARPVQYCQEQFPDTVLGHEFAEQDGLIRRVIEKHHLKVAFACVPRCFHAGFFGYHRFFAPHIKSLPLHKQVEQIKKIAFNVEQLRALVRQENLVQDSLPVDLNTQHTECKKILSLLT